MSNLIIHNGTVVTCEPINKVLYEHSIVVTKGKIEKIVPTSELDLAKYHDYRFLDASKKTVMPGLINAHMHFYSTFACGLGKAEPSKDFGEVLKNLWWRLDKRLSLEDTYYSALIPCIEAIKNGTTTLIDHHASPFAVTGSLTKIAKAVRETGLRACLCYEVSDRDGEEITRQGIHENVEFAKTLKNSPSPYLRAMFGLHASFTLSDKTLEQAASEGKHLGMGFHVHTAEAASDQTETKKMSNLSVVSRFKKHGILGNKTICAHAVHIDEQERDFLAESETMVVHNPQSNLNNAVGIADVLSLEKKGILVGLGTDAMTVNMREEIRCALWAQKYRSQNPSAAFMEIANTLLSNNAKIVQRLWDEPSLGTLTVGGSADIILLDYLPATPFSADNFLGHFIFGMANAQVASTIVNGRVLMHNRVLELPLDIERIYAKSRELSQALWNRF